MTEPSAGFGDPADDSADDSDDVERDGVGRRRPSWLGWRRMLPVAALALVVYYLVNIWLVVGAGERDEAREVDAIVVLGAAQYNGTPSPQLAARLDHAVDLYEQGYAEFVMVTGGKRPGDNFTEAEAGRAYLVERGVADTAILSENEGTNTFNSLDAAATILRRSGLDEVLLVTDPYHAERTELIAGEVGLDAYSSPTPESVVEGGTEWKRRLQEAAGVSVGRVIGFERLAAITG